MELIATLIRLALIECHERGILPWTPGQGAPESFNAECEIELNRYYVGDPGYGYWSGDYYVSLLGLLCVIDAEDVDGIWHSEIIERPHPEHCLCDECASVRYAMTGEAD